MPPLSAHLCCLALPHKNTTGQQGETAGEQLGEAAKAEGGDAADEGLVAGRLEAGAPGVGMARFPS